MKKLMARALPPLVPLIAIATIVEWLVRAGIIQSYLIPAPSAMLETLRDDFHEYLEAACRTLFAASVGLSASAFLGVVLALALSWSKWTQRALYPYAVFFQTVPLIAIAPILVIWFGFGLPTVVVSAVIASIFPVIANTLAGLWGADHALVDLLRLYRARQWQMVFKLRLPHAVPSIFTGVKIASGLAMIGAIVGEFIAGGGLGGLIDIARTQQRLDKVFAAVLIASFSGVFLIAGLNLLAVVFLKRFKVALSKT